MKFHPIWALDGFKVISEFDIDSLNCKNLNDEVFQLAILLYPPELINEKFLIKIRDCVLVMSEQHTVKKWLIHISKASKKNKQQLEEEAFLSEILNSKFNLITDPKVRDRIVEILINIPNDSIGEKLLKSYLFLIIGNVTRSDNIIKEIINEAPFENWKNKVKNKPVFLELAKRYLNQIVSKLSRHPTDRRVFSLFCEYVEKFLIFEKNLERFNDCDSSEVKNELDLIYIERLAPNLVSYIRFLKLDYQQQVLRLKSTKGLSYEQIFYWLWPVWNEGLYLNNNLWEGLTHLEKNDLPWFYFILDDERIIDLYIKKTGRSFIQNKRLSLHQMLINDELFMMALYRLIELGAIDQNIINETVQYLTNE